MKVRFSPEADADLADISAYISRDNPARARTFTQELVLACVALGEMPLGFPLLRVEPSGLRRKVHGGYLIIYRVAEEWVEIVRILHGARDVDRLLSRDAEG